VLGTYADKAVFETFLQKDKSSNVRSMEAVGNLKGKRFIIASEANENTKFDAAKVKELTGGDTLAGARMYGSSYTFKPTHTLWLACNHRPAIKDDTVAMWDRIKTIPFTRMFLDDDKDTSLPAKLKGEGDGIFNWLAEGAHTYLQNGLGETPAACRTATQEYREINDKLSKFIRECGTKEKGTAISKEIVYNIYRDWCETNNFEIEIDEKDFGKEVERRGTTYRRRKEGMFFLGYKWSLPVIDVGDVGHVGEKQSIL
jgi:putative DNA primase/helicase